MLCTQGSGEADSVKPMRKALLLLATSSAVLFSGCVVATPHLDLPGSYLPFGLVSLALYFLPTIIVLARHKKNVLGPILVNVLLGWTVIGWIVALIWALTVDE
jgi:Superinfection immunity protein